MTLDTYLDRYIAAILAGEEISPEPGEPGLNGEQGKAGLDGLDGEIGPQGETGPPGGIGPKGETGPRGERGAQGEIGPRGPKGPKGDQGEAGPAGPPGKDATPPDQPLLSFRAGGGVVVSDEATILGVASNLAFVGAGVTASVVAGRTVVTIPGGGVGTVDSVNGQTGTVVLSASDVGADASGAAAAAQAASQPLDSDLTAIAALSTTAYGRSLLTAASASALALHTPIRGEAFTGTGAATDFVLAHVPLYGVTVFLAGVRVDVTLVSQTITFGSAPILGATIRVDYEW